MQWGDAKTFQKKMAANIAKNRINAELGGVFFLGRFNLSYPWKIPQNSLPILKQL
jgi:hypothetical protein